MGTKNYKVLRDKISSDPTRAKRAERARQEAVAEHIEYALGEIRRAREITQVELAEALGLPQSNVSRVENADDVLVSTLARYIEALGGRLEISAVFGDTERITVRVA